MRDKGVVELLEAYDSFKLKHSDQGIKLFVIGNPEKWDGLPQATLDRLNNDGLLHKDRNKESCFPLLFLQHGTALPSHSQIKQCR